MPQESTLLAYLVPRLTSSVEDTATDALAFILNKSPACRDALGLLLREGEGSYQLDAPASFDTQVTYKDGSRPDMVGYDQGRAGSWDNGFAPQNKEHPIDASEWPMLGCSFR